MADSMTQYDTFIFAEMMVHPLFFTHPFLKKIAVIEPASPDLAQEILKHPSVSEVWQITQTGASTFSDPRVKIFSGDEIAWLKTTTPASFDAIIFAASNTPQHFKKEIIAQCAQLLAPQGIFLRQCDSLFALDSLKSACLTLKEAGFTDLQILHFPQPNFPSGSLAAIMAIKDGGFKRIREKDIFNRTFATRYYNFDTHKAALVIPEFMREELVF
jgi:spermidine synthase